MSEEEASAEEEAPASAPALPEAMAEAEDSEAAMESRSRYASPYRSVASPTIKEEMNDMDGGCEYGWLAAGSSGRDDVGVNPKN